MRSKSKLKNESETQRVYKEKKLILIRRISFVTKYNMNVNYIGMMQTINTYILKTKSNEKTNL